MSKRPEPMSGRSLIYSAETKRHKNDGKNDVGETCRRGLLQGVVSKEGSWPNVAQGWKEVQVWAAERSETGIVSFSGEGVGGLDRRR